MKFTQEPSRLKSLNQKKYSTPLLCLLIYELLGKDLSSSWVKVHHKLLFMGRAARISTTKVVWIEVIKLHKQQAKLPCTPLLPTHPAAVVTIKCWTINPDSVLLFTRRQTTPNHGQFHLFISCSSSIHVFLLQFFPLLSFSLFMISYCSSKINIGLNL